MGALRERNRRPSRMRTYQAPPASFDPNTAPSRLLRRYGLPERPDPVDNPLLARLWRLAFGGPTRLVTAELSPGPSLRRPQRLSAPSEFGGANNWTGAVVSNYSLGFAGESVQWAFGQFVIPRVVARDPTNEDLTVGFWVGLDGYFDQQVLQAGIRVDIHKDGGVAYSAFTEWINAANATQKQDYAQVVSNFPVQAGDTVSILVCAPQPDFGNIVLHNLTQGLLTAVGVPADPGISLEGSSAEWVVEGVSSALPFFYALTFMNCIGSTQAHLFDLSNASTTEQIGGMPYGTPVANAYIADQNIAVVQWADWWLTQPPPTYL